MKKIYLISALVLVFSALPVTSLADDNSLPENTQAAKTTTTPKHHEVTIRKTQTVDFEGDTIDGQARHPDGAYLVQKRSVDFVPLYKVREKFDENIKGSVDYLK